MMSEKKFSIFNPHRRRVQSPSRIMTAYSIFVKLCKEEHQKVFPHKLLDLEMFERKTADRWKTMTDREKAWFVQEEINGRKVKTVQPQSVRPVQTSTPVRSLKSTDSSTAHSPPNFSSADYNPFEKKKPSQQPPPSPRVRGSRQNINQIRAGLSLEPLRPEEHLACQPRKLPTNSFKQRLPAPLGDKIRDV